MNGFEQAVEIALANKQWMDSTLVEVVAKQRQRIEELEAELLRLTAPWPDDFFMLAEDMVELAPKSHEVLGRTKDLHRVKELS